MRQLFCFGLAAALMFTVFGCAPRVMVPPKIDLKQHEVIGIIEFSSSEEGELGRYATREFMEAARRDQGMVRIVELGSEAEALRTVGHERLTQAAFRALGETHEVSTIITGELIVSDVRPDITITPGFGYVSVGAEVDARLTAQMVETAGGASIWSSSATTTEKVGHVSVFGGKNVAFDAENPDEAYGKLIDALVESVTQDFRVTWKRK